MTIQLCIQETLQWSNLKKFLKSVGSLCVQEAQAGNFDHPHLPHRHIVEGGNHHKLSSCRIFRSITSSVDFFEIEGKAASRNMRGLEGRRLPCGTEVRLRQRGAGTPPSPRTLPPPSPSSPQASLAPSTCALHRRIIGCDALTRPLCISSALFLDWPLLFFLRLLNRSFYLQILKPLFVTIHNRVHVRLELLLVANSFQSRN